VRECPLGVDDFYWTKGLFSCDKLWELLLTPCPELFCWLLLLPYQRFAARLLKD
jgi:hypothetical protein